MIYCPVIAYLKCMNQDSVTNPDAVFIIDVITQLL